MSHRIEPFLRKAVGVCLWISSGVIVVAVVAVFFGLRAPEEVTTTVQWIGAVWTGVTLVAGMVLCWRLPGAAKWVAVIVEVFVLFAGVLLFSFQEAQKVADLPQSRLAQLRLTPGYVRIQNNLELAQKDLESLVNRTSTIPGNFTTGARELQSAKERTTLRVLDLEEQLQTVETASLGDLTPSSPDLFGSFGPEAAIWIQAVALFLFCLANEALAVLLLSSSEEPRAGQQPRSRVTARGARTIAAARVENPRLPEYLAAARALGRDGMLAGYRQVAPALGISETRARALLHEGLISGAIGKDRRDQATTTTR